MQLTDFIQALFSSGKVTVAGKPEPFEEDDLRATGNMLEAFYREDVLEMPGRAPSFDLKAAQWAAGYIYRAAQLLLLRNIEEEQLVQLLKDYEGQQTAAAIFSADLCLRHLPSLLKLAKGLAPGDILVTRITATLAQWPLSGVGAAIGPVTDSLQKLLENDSLRQLYADRIIELKDLSKTGEPAVKELVMESLGAYQYIFWPGFNPQPTE